MEKTIYLILKIVIVILLIIILLLGIGILYCKSYYIPKDFYAKNEIDLNNISKENSDKENENKIESLTTVELPGEKIEIITEIDDWRLTLVNIENPLPENFSIELAKINGSKEFDARAINELLRNDSSNERFRSF